jgi:Metalloenzyme superfamily
MRLQYETMRVAVLFIDGVGVGVRDPALNPLAREEYLLSQFADGTGTLLPAHATRHDVDTTFGIAGRPQSASNQTAIFTGQPAPSLLGHHVLGFPDRALRDLISRHSIVKAITKAGKKATFANAYPREYLDTLGLLKPPPDARSASERDISIPTRLSNKLKPSASTLTMAAGGVTMRTFDDARNGAGLTHDIDGSLGRSRGLNLPSRTPEEAAAIFWALSQDFTLFEHSLADEAGHEQDPVKAREVLSTFDAFARAVIAQRPHGAQVIICSDHGNVEDLSARNHTRNPVAVLVFGSPCPTPLRSVADVGRAVLALLEVAPC